MRGIIGAALVTEGGNSFVRFERVPVARGAKVVLHDISLHIAGGEHIAILGPNSSGKSMLIKDRHL